MKSDIKIFIVGGFFNNKRGFPTTPAEELKKILQRENITIYHASKYINRFLRLLDIFFSLIYYSRHYKIVNIQFYGGGLSIILETITCFISALLNKKIILTLHGGALPINIKKNKKLYLSILRRASVITCPSPFLIKELKQYGLNARLIENSIDLSKYDFIKKNTFRPRILWMRAFHPTYNPEMAIEVIDMLKNEYPDIIMHMAGTDYGYAHLAKEKVSALKLEDKIRFVGYINDKQKNELAQDCDIYICTNRIDNAPVSIIEMLSLGLAVVSTNVGGIPQLVENEKDALLVNNEDTIAMVDAIRRILQHADLGQQLVEQGRKKVQRYGESEVAEKWISLLNELT